MDEPFSALPISGQMEPITIPHTDWDALFPRAYSVNWIAIKIKHAMASLTITFSSLDYISYPSVIKNKINSLHNFRIGTRDNDYTVKR